MNIEEIEKNKASNPYYQANPEMFDWLMSYVKKYPKSCCKVISRRLNSRTLNRNFDIKHLISWMKKSTSHFMFNIELQTQAYCIVMGITSIDQFPKCKMCGKPMVQNAYSFSQGFTKTQFCNAKCRANNEDFKRICAEDRISRYGSAFGDPKKYIATRIKRHGRKNAKLSASLKAAYQNRKNEILKKRSDTLFNNYGVRTPMHSPELRSRQCYRYTYDGKHFDSSFEIALYIYLSDNHIEFSYQPNVTFEYEFDGKCHKYIPDFKIKNEYVEIKGDHFFKEDGTMQNPYDHLQDGLYESKHQCMILHNVKILRTSECQKYIDYVINKYGPSYLSSFHNKSKQKQDEECNQRKAGNQNQS